MSAKDQDEGRYTQTYKIDYARVDVAEIMDQVQAKAARAAAPDDAGEDVPGMPDGPVWQPSSGPLTLKKKVKRKLQRFLTPFFPVMRLMALPVHEDLMQTNAKLSEASAKIDLLLHRRDITKEYIKLLHVLCHNLVMELSKLRVEHDTLKSRVQVLEKDFAFLGKRESVLEKKIVP
ncbi:MAG: hypothetical protein A2Y56_04705 [Candidatus Aminicenantes bacterium RBG_13_63_10]|nr:MAG: hypothetical protein A2Y56_04705 [Candidatus Aminicenantes bacterium RBG_13_63_10]